VLGLGERQGSSFGAIGIRKRLGAFQAHTPLSGDRLLDIGCGNGSYTVRLAQHFAEVDAIDVEPDRLADVVQGIQADDLSARIHVERMSAERLSFPDATFDAVTAIEVLEHVPDLEACLAEVHRVLKPGGRLLLTGPNRLFPLETHGVLVRGRRLSPLAMPFVTWVPPLHRRVADARSFGARGLRRLVEAHGFRCTATAYLMPPFDRSRLGQRIRPVTDRLEGTPLRVFGLSLVMVFCRQESA
jgi:SAM-dependent methyltransferase